MDILEEIVIHHLREDIPGEEFSYSFLMNYLSDYKKPRDKITRLLNSGAIIRVKKGLYVFGDRYRKHTLCPELLANLIYGPSYVSLEYALAYYGMIPEGVHLVTSVTFKRNKLFQTPLGPFSYRHTHRDPYPIGIVLAKCDGGRAFYIASPEKALADLVASVTEITSVEEIDSFLLEHMRLDPSVQASFSDRQMEAIAERYHNPRVDRLLEWVRSS